MIKQILLVIIPFLIPWNLLAQEDCSILLRHAQKYYEDGIIEEVPGLLKGCLENGFTKEEKVEAYKLLILCSIYEDNIEQADQQMLTFLKANPEYEINTSVDAAEFIHFLKSYKTSEVISLGFTLGTNFTNPYYRELFGVENTESYNTDYTNSGFGFIVGPSFSRPVFQVFEVNVSFLFGQKKFAYTTDVTDFSPLETIETHNCLEFPVSVSYFRYGNKAFKPFITAGLNTSYLLNVSSDISRTYTEGNNDNITGTNIDFSENRNNLLFGAILGAGIEFKFNKGSVNALMRYNFGINTITNNEQRYTDLDQLFKYYLIDDKIILNNLYFSVSYMYPLYNHKKIN